MITLEQNTTIYNKDYDLNIKQYLDKADIEVIAEEMLKFKKTTEREYVKDILLCKAATDLPEDYDYANNYELLQSNGIFDAIYSTVKNAYEISEYVKYEESVQVQFNKFLEAINAPLNETIEKVGKLVTNLDSDKLVKLLAKKK